AHNRIRIREHGFLIREEQASNLPAGRCAAIPSSAFDYLSQLLAKEEARTVADEHHFFLSRTTWRGRDALKVRSHVGVLQTPCGACIEILPKAANSEGLDESSQVLVRMLHCLRSAPFRAGGEAQLQSQRMPLVEVFLGYFLREIDQLVKRGIRSDYLGEEENLRFLKGKLLLGKHLRANAVQQHRFFCSYDAYLLNRPENRLIRTALAKVLKLCRSRENERLARGLVFAFQDVPVSQDIAGDLARCRFNRGMAHYQNPLAWCRMILREEATVPASGSKRTISLLFPMEKVFEDYVARLLERTDSVHDLRCQAGSKWLVEAPRKKFQMRPDFLFWLDNQFVVGDAKWKLADQDAQDGKFGVSQADLYQLYAYGHKYLRDRKGRLFIFYPETFAFHERQNLEYEPGLN
ncbi:MAG: restriction endonuclease, partial [Gammaproteobacteria bacterium]